MNESNEFRELLIKFEKHVAICDERWNTTLREIRASRENDQVAIRDIKAAVDRLNKLVWSVGGSTIFILATALLAGILK